MHVGPLFLLLSYCGPSMSPAHAVVHNITATRTAAPHTTHSKPQTPHSCHKWAGPPFISFPLKAYRRFPFFWERVAASGSNVVLGLERPRFRPLLAHETCLRCNTKPSCTLLSPLATFLRACPRDQAPFNNMILTSE